MEKLIGLRKAIFYISFPFSFIGFILPVYASNIGASPLEVGILYSVFALCSILIRPFIGKWIDNRGRKSGVIIGLLAYTTVITLFLTGNNYTYIFIARVLQSIASSFLWISVYAMIADISKENNISRNIGIIDQVENKGLMIGSFIGFTILFNKFFETPFKFIFSIYLITSLIALYYGFFKTQETLSKDNNLFIKKKARINNMFIKFLIIMGILALVQSMLAPIYLIYFKDHITKDLALISFLYIPGTLLSMFLPKRFGILSDKYGRKNILVIGIIVQGLFVTIIPLISNYYRFMLIFTFISIGQMLGYTAKTALVTELTEGIERGRNYGFYHLAIGLGGTIGPLLGTYIYQQIDKQLVFYLQGITLIAISIFVSVIFNKKEILGIYNNLSTDK
jgi:MFS family permease